MPLLVPGRPVFGRGFRGLVQVGGLRPLVEGRMGMRAGGRGGTNGHESSQCWFPKPIQRSVPSDPANTSFLGLGEATCARGLPQSLQNKNFTWRNASSSLPPHQLSSHPFHPSFLPSQFMHTSLPLALSTCFRICCSCSRLRFSFSYARASAWKNEEEGGEGGRPMSACENSKTKDNPHVAFKRRM